MDGVSLDPKRTQCQRVAKYIGYSLYRQHSIGHGTARRDEENGAMKDLVVLLPGILGSVLRRDGRDVWAISGGAIVHGLLSLGGNIQDLILQDQTGDPDVDADGVTAPRLLDDLHMIPGLWKIDGYTKVADTLK